MGNTVNKHAAAGRTKISFPHALMSHRGGSLERVENTMPAFRRSALQLKVDLLEMDIHMTKDGECVIFHDGDMGRLCGLPGRHISDYNYKELPRLLIPEWLKDVEEVTSDPESTRIPLLRELLDEFPTYPMQIDVKDGTEEMVVKVGKLIVEKGRESQTVWGSFRDDVCDLCFKHFGTRIPLFFSKWRALKSYLLSRVGLTSWMRYRESALILPNLSWLLSPSWFKALNDCGVTVIVWGFGRGEGGPGGGINTVAGYERVRNSGANGICSDRPSLLKTWLQSNQLAPFRSESSKRD